MKKAFLNEYMGFEIQELMKVKGQITAITCFGSCENHGSHCCLGPDYFVPTEIARRVAEKLDNVIVVPCVPFGTSIHYNHYPISITLRYETVIAMAEDIFKSLIGNGIKHIYILNGHDGNIPALEIAAHNIKASFPEVKFLFLPAWWHKVGELMGDRFEVWSGLGHGGEGETSIMMAIRPDLVDLNQAVSQIPSTVLKIGQKADVIWDISEVSETGNTGDPTKATSEKGEQMLDILVDLVVSAITEMNKKNWDYCIREY